jgi:hypothetical protein
MKKILLTSLLSVGALGAYAQGILSFTDYDYGTQVTSVYSPATSSPNTSLNGVTTADTIQGSQTGSSSAAVLFPGSVPLGGTASGSGAAAYANGNLWSVQLEALAGTTAVPIGALQPVLQYTSTMNHDGTGGGAGHWVALDLSTDPGIPGTGLASKGGNGGFADVATAAWYNGGGDTTLAAAQTDLNGVWGESAEVADFSLTPVASQTGNPQATAVDQPTDSFTVAGTVVPEPSTIAFGVMGAFAFLARRKKS